MMSEFHFRVDLTEFGVKSQTPEENLNIARTKTLILPVALKSHLPAKQLKHGDTFTLTGVTGAYLKKLISDLKITNVKIDSESEEVVSVQGNLIATDPHGVYSMLFDYPNLSIGGIICDFDSLGIPDIYDADATFDGTFTYVALTSNSGYFLIKINSDGEATLIGELAVEDVDGITYIEDNKIALIEDLNLAIISTDDGSTIEERESSAFQSIYDIIYFEGELYGFGYSNVLYSINKDTLIPYGEGSEEDKKSNILSWTGDTELEVQDITMPFIYDNRLFAIAYTTESDEILIEVFPNTSEITFVSMFESDEIESISISGITETQNDEIGFANYEYKSNYAWYWDSVIWVDNKLFYKEPTLENLIVQWAEEFDSETWESIEITDIELNEDNRWEISFTEPEGNFVMRMRYSDGSGNLWTYIAED